MSLAQLKQSLGGAWPTLEKARETAREQVRKLAGLLTEEGKTSGSLVSADVSLVVTHSWWSIGDGTDSRPREAGRAVMLRAVLSV